MIIQENYYAVKAISNTALGYIDFASGGSPRKFKEFMDGTLQEEEAAYRRTGSLIHLAVLEPEKFKVADIEKPSDAVCGIVESVFNTVTEDQFADVLTLADYTDHILSAANAANYQTNWKDDTRVKKIIELGSEYFDYLQMVRESEEIVLTNKEFGVVNACAASLKTDPHISKVMFPDNLPEHIEVLREFEIYFDYSGFSCKAKLDQAVVNHKNKSVMLIDLKTTSKGIQDFSESFAKFQYDRQIAFYKLALEAKFPGYKLIMAAIAAVETTGYNRARLFVVPDKVIAGGALKITNCFAIIRDCMETGNWEYEPNYIESPYEIELA